MQKYFFTLAIVFFACTSIAQRTVPDFGKITAEDLRLASCPFEPDAAAMKLFDIEETEFDFSGYDSKLKTERRTRLKIFNEKGYKYASIKIPYFSKRGVSKIKDLKGVVYNLDAAGKIVTQKLEKKDFFRSKSENNVSEIDFTFPNLKPGSVVEFTYTSIQRNILQIDPWTLQDEIPTAYSSISITIPEDSRIKEKIYGEDTVQQIARQVEHGKTEKIYFKENIRSFQYEPFMSSYKDNLIRIVFILIPQSNDFIDRLTSPETMWKFAGSRLLNARYFGGQIDKIIPGTEGLVDSAKKILSVPERIKFIYDSVKKRVPDKIEQTMEVDDLIEAWNNRDGTSSEINLILLNLLQKVNVPSCAMLISTRTHGKINTNFPSTAQFNGVDVLAVDSNDVYALDASLKWQSFKNPPFNVLNRSGYLLLKDNMKWVTIEDSRPLVKQDILVSGILQDNGAIDGKITAKYFDYAKTIVLDSTDEEENKDQFVRSKMGDLKILSKKQLVPQIDADPLQEDIEFSFAPQQTDKFYFINPDFFSSDKNNPFLSNSRNTDIDFGCNQKLALTLLISVPRSFEIESVPKNLTVRAPDSSFFFQRFTSVDTSGIFMSQTFEIKRSIFGKEEYAYVQEFFKRVYAMKAEEIILRKK